MQGDAIEYFTAQRYTIIQCTCNKHMETAIRPHIYGKTLRSNEVKVAKSAYTWSRCDSINSISVEFQLGIYLSKWIFLCSDDSLMFLILRPDRPVMLNLSKQYFHTTMKNNWIKNCYEIRDGSSKHRRFIQIMLSVFMAVLNYLIPALCPLSIKLIAGFLSHAHTVI